LTLGNLSKMVKKVSFPNIVRKLTPAEILQTQGSAWHLVSNHIEKVGFSERTLLYACKKRCGIGPKAYLKILKLNDVYHTFRFGNIESSIAKLARESGFWHMVQFFKDYKKFYGELPSETILKSNKM